MLMASLKLVNPEAILLELAIAGPDPLEAVRLMHRPNPEVPLIVIGNSAEKETAAASLNKGAMNYLLKGQMDARTVERVLCGGARAQYAERAGGPAARPVDRVIREGTLGKAPAHSLREMRGSETILIAEDHESIREMARQTLVSSGYHVLSAGEGEEALRLCAEDTPAIAVLDTIMPKLGGVEVAERLTATFRRLAILFTSGYSQDSEHVAPPAGNTQYLQKPYSATTLGRLVREILHKEKRQAANS
jgi:CheY-like chemotaxis protein